MLMDDTAGMNRDERAAIAEALHRAAIHLLRSMRGVDAASGLSGPKLSALSVLAFAGPRSLGELAAAEQVSAPTMSKLVADLEADGLVTKASDPGDRRGVRIAVTEAGRALMDAGRQRRLDQLRRRFDRLDAADMAILARAAELIQQAAAGDLG
jgi:DNA-binding MarR family transcriptional regulator